MEIMMPIKSRKTKAKKTVRKAAKVDKAPEIAVRRRRGSNKVNEESKALFLDHHLPKIARLRDVVATATANLRNGYKTANADGFLKRDFDVAFRLKGQLGEKEIKAQIARDMTIAKWLGFAIGKQLDLFLDADDHDVEGQAYSEGEEASRENRPAEPIYAPGTPGFDAYMRGFHDHQEEMAQGIKKAGSVSAVGAPAQSAGSGVPMTRSQFRAQQAAAKKAQEYVDAQQKQLFTKRTPDEAAE
jgi:hypothetical protein